MKIDKVLKNMLDQGLIEGYSVEEDRVVLILNVRQSIAKDKILDKLPKDIKVDMIEIAENIRFLGE